MRAPRPHPFARPLCASLAVPARLAALVLSGASAVRVYRCAELRRFQAGEFDEIAKAFRTCDRDRSGDIDARELSMALYNLGMPTDHEQVHAHARAAHA